MVDDSMQTEKELPLYTISLSLPEAVYKLSCVEESVHCRIFKKNEIEKRVLKSSCG